MKAAQPYLNFDGNAREAMHFYRRCLDAELEMQTFRETGHAGPPGTEDRVMHARLEKGPMVVMASDSMPGTPYSQGNNFHVAVHCDSVAEIERVFARFAEGGSVTLPLQYTFWGSRFGMLTDKFGVHWMFNCEPGRDG